MKIYTKTGDGGETSLASGERVSKADIRVGLYGTADELNSFLGLSLVQIDEANPLLGMLSIIQNLLFELGSELAGFRKKEMSSSPILEESDVTDLENWIDSLTEQLEPLKSFILPGGSMSSSHLHVSRTIARRLEREMVLAKKNGVEIFDLSLRFVNRLSDFLFVAARFNNSLEKIPEPIWKSRAKGVK